MSSAMSPRAVFRLAWRHALGRPLQGAFLVVGVMIGVAMIVGIDLANSSAERAFSLGVEAVTGRANYQILGGPTGLDASVYTEIRRDLGYRNSAPVVEDYVVVEEFDRQPIRLLGVDPFAEAPFRSYLAAAGTQTPSSVPVDRNAIVDLLVEPGSALISADNAEKFGLGVGDELNIRYGTQPLTLHIAGLLAPDDDANRRALETLAIVDIASAQEALNRFGRLNRIDLLVQGGAAGEADLDRIATVIPDGARLVSVEAKSGAVEEMTRAFRLNLSAMSLLALVVGMFLIYNTMTFSVVQRRSVLGSLRALGMTRREIYMLILGEALALGVLGTLAGLFLGIFLGRGMVGLVTQTMNDLFFVVSVRETSVDWFTLAKGAFVGLGAAIIGATAPAIEATSVAPTGAMQRSGAEERVRRLLPKVTLAAVGLIVAGGLLLIPDGNLVASFAGLFLLIIGGALLTPMMTLGLMSFTQTVSLPVAGIIGRMAPRYVVRSLSRTSVAIAALMVAVSVIIGVGIMIGSFRNTVDLWLNDVLQADIFVSPPSLSANQVSTALPPDVVSKIADFEGVDSFLTTREVNVTLYPDSSSPDEPASNAGAVDVRLIALSGDLAGEDRKYRSSVGDWQETWQALEQGGAIINEPLAQRQGLTVGDTIALQTDSGPVQFPIVGVSVSYDVGSVVYLYDPVFRTWWEDDALSALALFVEPGVDVDETVDAIRAAFAGRADLVIRSNQGTRADALEVFDRTFAITVALQLLAMLVAFIGILSTLMSLQLERIREIGVLRSNGMTRAQLWRLSLYETGLIGGSAGLFAIPTGLVLAAVLIYIINLRSFGWSLEMQLTPGDFTQALLVAVGAALLAGIYPAWRLGRMQPAEAVRAE